MNDAGKSHFEGFDAPKHKPRISMIKDNGSTFYKCSDGSLDQFGWTPEEAFLNLVNCRK